MHFSKLVRKRAHYIHCRLLIPFLQAADLLDDIRCTKAFEVGNSLESARFHGILKEFSLSLSVCVICETYGEEYRYESCIRMYPRKSAKKRLQQRGLQKVSSNVPCTTRSIPCSCMKLSVTIRGHGHTTLSTYCSDATSSVR
jgi:hypothetical protein